MSYYKKKYSSKEYEQKEVAINVGASIISGAISSALTNPMECITVNRQAHSNF